MYQSIHFVESAPRDVRLHWHVFNKAQSTLCEKQVKTILSLVGM